MSEPKKPSSRREPSVFRIEVRLRPDFADSAGAEALARLQELGIAAAKEVRVSRLYELRGPYTVAQTQQACKELLCDSVTEEFKLLAAGPTLNGMNHWRIEVWLKPSVTDPVGETVRDALKEMGLPEADSVRSGVAYRISGKCHRAHLEKAAAKSLANPIIHRVSVSEATL